MHAYSRDLGAVLRARYGLAEAAVTGGTAFSGAGFDKTDYDAQTLKALVPFAAVLAENETLTLAAVVESAPVADFSAGVTTLKTFDAAFVAATGGTGGTTETVVAEFDADITGAQQFVRLTVTPTFSASGTATAGIVYVTSGEKIDPVTSSPAEAT